LLSFEEALDLVLSHAWLLTAERLPLQAAAGRILAEDVQSDVDVPPFDKSAMDGYACRRADLPGPLEVLGEVPAGGVFASELGARQCVKIFTGAPVPSGADCVIIIEQTESAGDRHIRFTATDTASNTVPRGDDLHSGDLVLTAGTLLRAEHLGMLAMAGTANPAVSRRPRVAVFSTGDELVPPDQTPGPGQIRNSNSFQLVAQAAAAGAEVRAEGIAADTAAALRDVMQRALAENDVVISSGGVSMGDYDLVPALLAEQGLEVVLRRVAIQPGKPIAFAHGPGKAYFGLSGNPFSSFVQFTLFVQPFLRRMQGCLDAPLEVTARLATTLRRKNTERMAWFPVALKDGLAHPVTYHGSAHIAALAAADALAAYPLGCDHLEAGHELPVRLLRTT